MYIIEEYLIPFLFLAFSLAAYGQSDENVKLRFVTFPKTPEPIKAELLMGLKAPVKIEASSNAISEPVSVPSMKEWVIGETSVNPAGEEVFNIFGRVPAAGSKEQIILILRKGSELSEGAKLILIDDTTLAFDLGKILFLNATKINIGGIVGKDKFAVRPGNYKVVEPKPDASGRYYHTRLFYEKDGKPKGFYNSNWPYSENSRVMVFIYQDSETGKIHRHVVRGGM
jgi:hypothetical protein